MINLSNYPKFKLDISSSVVNIHPIAIIRSSPEIYLSQNEETIDGNNYISMNLNIPSIKESISIESRKLKINNITLSFSNKDYFSDKFSSQNFLNIEVDIYWKSQSCTSVTDCLPVYKAIIKRVDHDYKNIKFILEDLSQKVLHKDVPTTIITSHNRYREKDRNKEVPITYGHVDKAPCVYWKEQSLDTATVKKVFLLTNKYSEGGNVNFEGETHSGTYLDVSGNKSTGSLTRTPLSLYSGAYLFIPDTYSRHTYSQHPPSASQWYRTSLDASGKIYLEQIYSGETPWNVVADGSIQGVFNRAATSVNLIDDAEYADYVYKGNDDGIYIDNPTLSFNTSETMLGSQVDFFNESYATIPDSSLNSLEQFPEVEDGWFRLDGFWIGKTGGSWYEKGIVTSYSEETAYDSDGLQQNWTKPLLPARTYQDHVAKTLYYAADRPVEFICMPDSKKMHDYFSYAKAMELGNLEDDRFSLGNYIGSVAQSGERWDYWASNQHYWSRGEGFGFANQVHRFGLPHAFTGYEILSQFGVYGATLHGTDAQTIFLSGRENYYWEDYDDYDYPYHGYDREGITIPNPLFRFGTNYHTPNFFEAAYNDGVIDGWSSGWFNPYDNPFYANTISWEFGAYMTFDKDADLNPISGYDVSKLHYDFGFEGQDHYIIQNISFWEAFGFWGFGIGGDYENQFPRYRVISQLDEETDTMNDDWGSGEQEVLLTNKNYEVYWNGVSKDYWNNTGEWGGHFGSDNENWINQPYSGWDITYNNVAPYPYYGNGERLAESQESSWNNLTSRENNWVIYYYEDYTDEDTGTFFPKGTLMPTTTINQFPFSWNLTMKRYFNNEKMYPAPITNTDVNFVSLNKGDGFTEDTKDTRLGLIFDLEEASIDDVVGNGVSIFWGSLHLKNSTEITQDSDSVRLYMNWYPVDTSLDEEQYYNDEEASYNLGNVRSATATYLNSNWGDEYAMWANTHTSTANYHYKSIFSKPEDFNAAALRFWVRDDENTNAQVAISVRAYHLGVKHVVDVENIYSKDFYLNTFGKNLEQEHTNAASVIYDLIKHELEVDVSYENVADAYSHLVSQQLSLAFSVNKKINSKNLIEDIGKNSSVIPLFKSNGNLSFSIIRNEYTESDKLIKSEDIISNSFTRTKIENVKTICRVKYKKDYAEGTHKEITGYTDAYDFYGNGDLGYPDGYNKTYYGLDPNKPSDSILEFESDYIRDNASAKKLRDFLLAYHCNQHNIIKARLPLTYVDLEVADIVEFDKLINDMKAYGEDYTESIFRNGQEIYPYFMITSVNKSIKHVDIECIQMHNLTKNTDLIEHGSGDVLRVGAANEAAVVEVFSYLAGDKPYFTEAQLLNADIDLNYVVNDNDAAILEDTFFPEPEDYDYQDDLELWDWNNVSPTYTYPRGTLEVLSNLTAQWDGNGTDEVGSDSKQYPNVIEEGKTYSFRVVFHEIESLDHFEQHPQISFTLSGAGGNLVIHRPDIKDDNYGDDEHAGVWSDDGSTWTSAIHTFVAESSHHIYVFFNSPYDFCRMSVSLIEEITED